MFKIHDSLCTKQNTHITLMVRLSTWSWVSRLHLRFLPSAVLKEILWVQWWKFYMPDVLTVNQPTCQRTNGYSHRTSSVPDPPSLNLRDFWRHFYFCLSKAAVHSDCCFFASCTNILTYLLTYLPSNHKTSSNPGPPSNYWTSSIPGPPLPKCISIVVCWQSNIHCQEIT